MGKIMLKSKILFLKNENINGCNFGDTHQMLKKKEKMDSESQTAYNNVL